MAKRKSNASDGGPREKHERRSTAETRFDAVLEIVERERAQLAKVETALEVLVIALVHHDTEPGIRPYYANQVELALEPLKGVLRRLDTVNIDRALAAR